MEIMTVRQAAQRWGITPRRVQELIRAGRIETAYKIETVWVMPDDTPKPPDLRLERKNRRQKNNGQKND
jgi:hypothetical protein